MCARVAIIGRGVVDPPQTYSALTYAPKRCRPAHTCSLSRRIEGARSLRSWTRLEDNSFVPILWNWREREGYAAALKPASTGLPASFVIRLTKGSPGSAELVNLHCSIPRPSCLGGATH